MMLAALRYTIAAALVAVGFVGVAVTPSHAHASGVWLLASLVALVTGAAVVALAASDE